MKQSYLHPVITPKGNATTKALPDDNSHLSIKQIKTDDYIVTVDLNLNDEYVLSLIESGQAQYLYVIECDSTRYRQRYIKSEPHIDIAVPRKSVVNKVKVLPYVIVNETIDYQNPLANECYDGCVFELTKGDVLVEFQGRGFNAEITYAIDNIFKIKCNPDPEVKHVEYWLEDKIRIVLPHHDFNTYRGINGDARYFSTIKSSFVMNALLYALFMGNFDQDERDGEENWAKTIRAAVDSNKLSMKYDLRDKTQYPVLAQDLLDNVFSTLFNDISGNLPPTEYETEKI